jgi:hypothetical protein
MTTQYLIVFTTLKVNPSISSSLSLLAFLHYCPLLVHLHFCPHFISFRTYFTYVFMGFTFNVISLHLSLYSSLADLFSLHSIISKMASYVSILFCALILLFHPSLTSYSFTLLHSVPVSACLCHLQLVHLE